MEVGGKKEECLLWEGRVYGRKGGGEGMREGRREGKKEGAVESKRVEG